MGEINIHNEHNSNLIKNFNSPISSDFPPNVNWWNHVWRGSEAYAYKRKRRPSGATPAVQANDSQEQQGNSGHDAKHDEAQISAMMYWTHYKLGQVFKNNHIQQKVGNIIGDWGFN